MPDQAVRLPRLRRRWQWQPRHPAQLVAIGFAAAIAIGTALLLLPIAKAGAGGAAFREALFTATSAVCVTGLTVVDTATYWSGFGQVVILVLIQVGGLGIMTFAAFVVLFAAGRLGMRTQITVAAESKNLGIGGVKSVILGVLRITVVTESVIAAILTVRFVVGYGKSPLEALWLGVFHSVSAFNNAGFALFSDNLMGFAGDGWVLLPLSVAVIIGGLGFPVIFEFLQRLRKPARWSLHSRVVLVVYIGLVVAGTVFIALMEWRNPRTLGPMSVGEGALNAFVASVMTRTAGFNAIDIAGLDPGTWLGMDALMFIGGGSAGTAGGIKVTTFAVLLFVVLAEARGDTDVTVFKRRLPASMQRQALTIAILAAMAVAVSTLVLVTMTRFSLDTVLFEVVSAFATVGLSAGITDDLPAAGQFLLAALMFIGRLGPAVLASALVLRTSRRLFEPPKERIIIG